MPTKKPINRRGFHRETLGAVAGLALVDGAATLARSQPPAIVTADSQRPQITCGVSSGDVGPNRAILWSRSDRPARMVVELSQDESFRKVRRVLGPQTGPQRDFTAKLEVRALTPGADWHYRVRFQDLEDPRVLSEPVVGHFRTAPEGRGDIKFLWGADTAGQGYGIDVARGGMQMYRTMANLKPDFFVHTGDNIYADNPFSASMMLSDGSEWRNIVTPETSKVAETLDEFRAKYRYNFLDEHFRAFHSQVPTVAMWDDHETLNNWYPGEQLVQDDRYSVKSVALLASRARTAFFDYLPIGETLTAPGRIDRSIRYGEHLELFCLDLRSYRGPNPGRYPDGEANWTLLGADQMRWLKRRLKASRATWKVFCCDMPLGLQLQDRPEGTEGVGAGDGPPVGRESEIADLLRFLKRSGIRNTIWLTGDVHYAASHYYDPSQAVFQEFDPFWEFVSGPIHAGTFGPGRLDNTFGPTVKFQGISKGMKGNRPPSEGLQFCGEVRIDGATGRLTVTHYNLAGDKLWSVDLDPQDAPRV